MNETERSIIDMFMGHCAQAMKYILMGNQSEIRCEARRYVKLMEEDQRMFNNEFVKAEDDDN